MPMRPRSGSFRVAFHRKSWSSSSALGCLKLNTWQPWGFTPDITCLMALSLPAASIAWKISSSAYWSDAYSTFCWALRLTTSSARSS